MAWPVIVVCDRSKWHIYAYFRFQADFWKLTTDFCIEGGGGDGVRVAIIYQLHPTKKMAWKLQICWLSCYQQ